MMELPVQDPCELCEGIAGRDEKWAVVEECSETITVVNPYQFEIGQCCVITRRHAGMLLDLSDAEGNAIIAAAQRVAYAMVAAYQPLGILTYQNNGVYSGQEVPHYHYHVVPRQPGSDWGIGRLRSRYLTALGENLAPHTTHRPMPSVGNVNLSMPVRYTKQQRRFRRTCPDAELTGLGRDDDTV